MFSAAPIAVLWALCAASLVWSWLDWNRAREMRRRMERLDIAPKGGAIVPARPGVGRWVPRQWAGAVGMRLRARWPGIGQRAGLTEIIGATGLTIEELAGLQVLVALAGAVLGLLIMAGVGLMGTPFVLALPVAGWFGFDVWLLGRASSRRRSIERALLTVMDLLGLSLEAGMGLDRAIRLICDRVDSPLTEELRLVLAEIDLGVARRVAFSHLAERLDLEDVRSLSTAIVQADELSMSVVESMRIQAHGLRVKRRQEAEAQAQRAPVKMLFPMVFFVLPALFIIILAPAVLALMKALPS